MTFDVEPAEGDTVRCYWRAHMKHAQTGALSGLHSALVHPARTYIGVRIPEGPYAARVPLSISVRAVDVLGRRVSADSVHVRVARIKNDASVHCGRMHRAQEYTGTVECVRSPGGGGGDARCDVRQGLPEGKYDVIAESSDGARTVARLQIGPVLASHDRDEAVLINPVVAPGDDVVLRTYNAQAASAGSLQRRGMKGLIAVLGSHGSHIEPFNTSKTSASVRFKAQRAWGSSVRVLVYDLGGRPGPSLVRGFMRDRLSVRDAWGGLVAHVRHPGSAQGGGTVSVVVQASDIRGRPAVGGRVALWITSGDASAVRPSRWLAHVPKAQELKATNFWDTVKPVTVSGPTTSAGGTRMGGGVPVPLVEYDGYRFCEDGRTPGHLERSAEGHSRAASAWPGETPVWQHDLELDQHGQAVTQVVLPKTPGVYQAIAVVSAQGVRGVLSGPMHVATARSTIRVRE